MRYRMARLELSGCSGRRLSNPLAILDVCLVISTATVLIGTQSLGQCRAMPIGWICLRRNAYSQPLTAIDFIWNVPTNAQKRRGQENLWMAWPTKNSCFGGLVRFYQRFVC